MMKPITTNFFVKTIQKSIHVFDIFIKNMYCKNHQKMILYIHTTTNKLFFIFPPFYKDVKQNSRSVWAKRQHTEYAVFLFV